MTTEYPATAKQLDLIGRLVAERKQATDVLDVEKFNEILREERLTKTGASSLLDYLFTVSKDVAPATNGGPARNGEPSNRYAGTCVLCGNEVAEGAGTYRRGTSVRWETLHLPGDPACAKGEAVVKADAKGADAWAEAKESFKDIPDGGYAVPSVTGTNDLTFVRLVTNKGFYDPSKKGQRSMRHVVGGNNEAMKVSPAWIIKVSEAIKAAGVNESAILYGQEIGACGFCMKSLTKKYSRGLGYGPDCADHHGLPFDYAAYAASETV